MRVDADKSADKAGVGSAAPKGLAEALQELHRLDPDPEQLPNSRQSLAHLLERAQQTPQASTGSLRAALWRWLWSGRVFAAPLGVVALFLVLWVRDSGRDHLTAKSTTPRASSALGGIALLVARVPTGGKISQQINDGASCHQRDSLIFRFSMASDSGDGFVYLFKWQRKLALLYPHKPKLAKQWRAGGTYDILAGQEYSLSSEEGKLGFLLLKSARRLTDKELEALTKGARAGFFPRKSLHQDLMQQSASLVWDTFLVRVRKK